MTKSIKQPRKAHAVPSGAEDSDPALNAIGPAGVAANVDVGEIVSGQPAGGPHDLGRKAHEENDRD
ncbi:hypothetical protein ACFB49_47040 [Sphingomonas sp. DBB INV C78]